MNYNLLGTSGCVLSCGTSPTIIGETNIKLLQMM